jgi:hypothetical protein
VNTIAPGFIETTAATVLIRPLGEQQNVNEDAARDGLMRSLGGIPIGRPGLQIVRPPAEHRPVAGSNSLMGVGHSHIYECAATVF